MAYKKKHSLLHKRKYELRSKVWKQVSDEWRKSVGKFFHECGKWKTRENFFFLNLQAVAFCVIHTSDDERDEENFPPHISKLMFAFQGVRSLIRMTHVYTMELPTLSSPLGEFGSWKIKMTIFIVCVGGIMKKVDAHRGVCIKLMNLTEIFQVAISSRDWIRGCGF